ncbi:MAG: LysE family transporter [Ignavibacteria bacterium]|nr:LysE family transporter [Ignavibacteria bacterium]
MFQIFISGLFLGISVAVPIGPVGLLCIDRTIKKHFWSGFFSGIGAASADALYGLIAGLGITFISNLLIKEEFYFQLIGGILLVAIGIKSFKLKPRKMKNYEPSKKKLARDFFSAFILTITNPGTVIFFMAVFSGFGLAEIAGQYFNTFILVAGIFIGSVTWWFFLSGTAYFLKPKINEKFLTGLNHLSSTAIIIFGLVILASLLFNKSIGL